MSSLFRRCICLLFFTLSWTVLHADPLAEAEQVVILVNSSDPKSVELGEYYAQRRSIPKANIIGLELSSAETIGWQEYVDTLHNPLLNKLLANGWIRGVKAGGRDALGREGLAVAVHSIRYLVTVRGVPLRISNSAELAVGAVDQIPAALRFNRAAVDSELALLAAPANLATVAYVPNPFFNQLAPAAVDTARVIPVSRLDGPKYSDVAKLIDRSLEAEAHGLMGRAYIDLGGPHKRGDVWLEAAGEAAAAAFFDTDFERTKRAMGYIDRLDAPAIYMGWYRANADGPWRAPRWSVPAGAIGFHLHSFSAVSVRDVKQGWLGAFVAQGYCATVGNVYEPYLDLTHRPDLLLQHLLAGHSFGEAVMYSVPALSWMGVAIGDPLYRPFKLGFDAQLQQAQSAVPDTYLILRQINRLRQELDAAAALEFARKQFSQNPSLVLAYRLADLYVESGQDAAAVDALRIVRYLTVFAEDERVVVQRIADFLHERGQGEFALELYQRILNAQDLDKSLRIKLLKAGTGIAESVGDWLLASKWGEEFALLTAPVGVKQ